MGAKPSSGQQSAPNPCRAAWVQASEVPDEEGAGGRARDPVRALVSCRHLSAGRGNQLEEAPSLLCPPTGPPSRILSLHFSSWLFVVVVVCQQMGDFVFVLNQPGVSSCDSQGCFW